MMLFRCLVNPEFTTNESFDKVCWKPAFLWHLVRADNSLRVDLYMRLTRWIADICKSKLELWFFRLILRCMCDDLGLILQTQTCKGGDVGLHAFDWRSLFLDLKSLNLRVNDQLAHFDLGQSWLKLLRRPRGLDQLMKRLSVWAEIARETQLIELMGDLDVLCHCMATPVDKALQTSKGLYEFWHLTIFWSALAALKA